MAHMNSLKREIGASIHGVLCVAASVVFGLLQATSLLSDEPPKVVRIDGKEYPISTFAGPTQSVLPLKAGSRPAKASIESKELPWVRLPNRSNLPQRATL